MFFHVKIIILTRFKSRATCCFLWNEFTASLIFRNFSYLKSSYLIGERLVKVIDLFETDFKSIYEEDFSLFISFKRVQIPFFKEIYLWV